MKKYSLAVLTLTTTLLSGCLVPERFSAKVEVQPDASYSYSYAGTAVHALAALQLKQGGSLSAKDETGLKGEAEKLRKNPDVREATYKGDARYNLVIEGKKKAGEAMTMLSILNVKTDKDGVMTIASAELSEKGKKDLQQLGITIDGTLEVKLPKNAEIISHNATSTPSFFGMFGTYSWKIGRIDQRPLIKVRLKQ